MGIEPEVLPAPSYIPTPSLYFVLRQVSAAKSPRRDSNLRCAYLILPKWRSHNKNSLAFCVFLLEGAVKPTSPWSTTRIKREVLVIFSELRQVKGSDPCSAKVMFNPLELFKVF